MVHISGYQFETKHMADQAMSYLNTHHGLPTENGITMFGEGSYSQHADGFYYIAFDSEWTSALGDPIEIYLTEQP